MKDALARSQSLYKKGKFPLALEILESNVSLEDLAQLSEDEQLIVLDLLASLCEKQGFMGRARKYATRMVRINDHDLRGYLRLGKLLQLIPGKLGEALRVYRRAVVKVVPLAPSHKEFLDKQIGLCVQKQTSIGSSSPEAISVKMADPVTRLPRDLLYMVFSQLSLRERAKCSLVSRQWCHYLSTEALLWSDLHFESPSSESSKTSIVSPETVVRYCNRSGHVSWLKLDFQSVFVRDPASMLPKVLSSHASRLQTLLFETTSPVTHMPTLGGVDFHSEPSDSAESSKVRLPGDNPSMGIYLPNLREVRISSDNLERDVRRCVEGLPSLEILDLSTTSLYRIRKRDVLSRDLIPAGKNLHSVSLMGRPGAPEISDELAASLVRLPSLRSIDLHRVLFSFWPIMHGAVANPELKRFGFTTDTTGGSTFFVPLPKFAGQLNSLTLNDTALTCVSAAPLLPDGTRYLGGSRTAMQELSYLELKRVSLAEYSLAELVNSWGCAGSLNTLVVHSMQNLGSSLFPPPGHLNFEVLPNLETFQFTGMRSVTDDFLQWLINACANLRKLNLDGTVITGPRLVKLVTGLPKLQVVRCKNVVDMSADTVAWIRQLKKITVIF